MTLVDVFLVFLRLGCTSFGGPVAHLSYFRREFVERRRWLDEHAYASVVALCQFLPGPASSQVGIALGLMRAGVAGALAAFVAFTAPSALLMIAFALVLDRVGDVGAAPWVHGLKLAAVAVVAQAVWSMAKSLTPDLPRALFGLAALAAMLVLPFAWAQVAVIAVAAILGALLLKPAAAGPPLALPVPPALAWASLALFAVLLVLLPFAAPLGRGFAVADAFYRTGALVFGGGHVVLPLLQKAAVAPGWIDRAHFLAGYGAAQAMPGPLFSFAAFLGAAMKAPPNGLAGAALALGAIYLPSFLLVFGAAPLWSEAQRHAAVRSAVAGVNAAVVGILAAALYSPVWTGAVFGVVDAAIAILLFAFLVWRNVPPWAAVVLAVLLALAAPA